MDDTHLFSFPAPPPQLDKRPNTTRLLQCTLRVLAWDYNLRERLQLCRVARPTPRTGDLDKVARVCGDGTVGKTASA